MDVTEFEDLIEAAREALRSDYSFAFATAELRAAALPPAPSEMLVAMTNATERFGVDPRAALAFVEQRFFAPDASPAELAAGFLLASAGFSAERSSAAARS